jgi:hypothetical protein
MRSVGLVLSGIGCVVLLLSSLYFLVELIANISSEPDPNVTTYWTLPWGSAINVNNISLSVLGVIVALEIGFTLLCIMAFFYARRNGRRGGILLIIIGIGLTLLGRGVITIFSLLLLAGGIIIFFAEKQRKHQSP